MKYFKSILTGFICVAFQTNANSRADGQLVNGKAGEKVTGQLAPTPAF
jgi:hypothetical protein